MQYRKFGKLDLDVSTMGLGCMRFPEIQMADGTNVIDESHAISMIHYAIDNGVNYIDTAYPYHGGKSEVLVGKALKSGYREKVNLVTKLPCWKANTYEDFEKIFEEQLNKLQTGYVDFYLLHALDKNKWEKMKSLNVFDFLHKEKAAGRIRHIGFSFHDELPVFKEIVDFYEWDMCQIQLNILDEEYQAGLEGLKYASSKGIGVVIMEPLRGGALVQNVPNDVMNVWNKSDVKREPVEWALNWLCNFPEVKVVLSGASTLDQVKQNVEIFANAKPNGMTEAEIDLVNEVKSIYKNKIKVGCTRCAYCMPCPAGVDIPEIFRCYNNASMFEVLDKPKNAYMETVKNNRDAGKCVSCGKCEKLCPQSIKIIDKLKEAAAFLTK